MIEWVPRSLGDNGWRGLVVPLLAVPQITHYLLDGFLWRRRSNPRVAEVLGRVRP